MSDTVEIKANNLGGESILEAPVRVMKKVGDLVSAEEVVFVVETDKTSLEISTPVSGVITELRVSDEEVITKGQVLAVITKQEVGSDSSKSESKQPEMVAPPSAGPVQVQTDSKLEGQSTTAEKQTSPGPGICVPGIDEFISGGLVSPAGRASGSVAVRQDAQSSGSALQQRVYSEVDGIVSAPGERRVKMSKIRQVIASRLKESQNTAATLSTFNEVDMSAVMALRSKYREGFEKKYEVKLGFMSFFIKAVVLALKEIPVINAEISGDEIIYRDYCNIGVAVGTDKGLVVPVIRRAETMSFAELEQELVMLSKKARGGTLTVADMSGATFTITNGGVYGSLLSTPIINPPQSGILGMHAIQERPVVVGGSIEIRPMMYLALSYDHRIVDGQGAVTFLVRVKQYIEDPSRLSLEI
ncbi:2-oxoglutarate dehydrogenase complex dihydrolipoyllysine-residue succinyltransferase [Anaplasma capra]|uniref:2-oxoglutarate dehydrogenase complex dihydrolipoyllysine-residue succinyltransferase n=1 Tax=Anaplasma capra TaxID=1562740 RepID=UPI0021D5E680|nr:2-oxoglutarate dehydrogenase complex dihydrolipoyllysine-residue succinyltransferase [Anaplasma capra]MCU7611281.1 2-oxoglutarate dehydrogenase complex dihydrolipoyllysine-residue succinyltransferase [Anaplasma capra]MCU7612710.1 2-oxoglutarate dehydrogenase complex dihydrolipoyllysine-residue succinyltransferase [Anaplasma capra]